MILLASEHWSLNLTFTLWQVHILAKYSHPVVVSYEPCNSRFHLLPMPHIPPKQTNEKMAFQSSGSHQSCHRSTSEYSPAHTTHNLNFGCVHGTSFLHFYICHCHCCCVVWFDCCALAFSSLFIFVFHFYDYCCYSISCCLCYTISFIYNWNIYMSCVTIVRYMSAFCFYAINLF